MDQAKLFLSSFGDGDPGDPGDPIGQSLRWRDSSGSQTFRSLNGISTSEYTLSFWCKLAQIDRAIDAMLWQSTNGSGPNLYINFNSAAGGAEAVLCNVAQSVTTAPNKMRDAGAWYHVVYQYSGSNGATNKIFVNGELWTSASVDSSLSGTFAIGGPPSTPQPAFEGYMAQWYLLDGQILPPTSFGRYNQFGVWVPKNLEFPEGTTYSGFTSAGPGGPTYEPRGQRSGYVVDGELSFDGSTSTKGHTYNNNAIYYLNYTFEGVTSLRINSGRNIVGLWINGVDVGYTDPDGADWWRDISAHIPADGVINEIAFLNDAGDTTWLHALEVNGTVLTNDFQWSSTSTFNFTGSQDVIDNGPSAANLASTESVYPAGSEQFYGWQDNTSYASPGPGEAWLVRFPTPIQNVSKVRVFVGVDEKLWLNGNDTGVIGQNNAWVTLHEGAPITVENICGLYCPGNTYNGAANSAFARIEINGQVYLDGVNPTFGLGGFHIDFSDPNDIGFDKSGSGNHFVTTGFDTRLPKEPQWQTYASSWGTHYSNDPSLIFSGEATSNFRPWDWYFMTPATPAEVSGILREAGAEAGDTIRFDVYPRNGSVYADINSGEVTNSTSGNALSSVSVTVPAGGLTTLTVRGDDSTYWGIGAIYLNGTMLTNGLSETLDWMLDSPTQNYSLPNDRGWAPSSNYGKDVNYDQALVKAIDSNYAGFISSLGYQTEGKYAYQFVVKVEPLPVCYIGIVGKLSDWQSGPRPDFPGYAVTLDTSAYPGYAQVYGNASPVGGNHVTMTYGVTSPDWQPITVLIDCDEHQIRWDIGDVEGAWIDYEDYIPAGMPVAPYISVNGDLFIDFGQRDSFTPPEGFTAVAAPFAPEPEIYDPKEHFQALTGPGTGYLVYNEGEASNPDEQQAANLSNLVGSTPTGAFMTSSVIYDMGLPVTSAQPGFQTTGGYWATAGVGYQPIRTLVSLTGEAGTWTLVDEGTYTDQSADTYININTVDPFRYVRMRKDTTNNNLALAGPTVGGILDLAVGTFPVGMYMIKDRENSNQWQIINTGKGKATVVPFDGIGDGNSQQSYVAPTGQCVAHCWSAPEIWTNTGITNGYRNKAAGFSMFQYTGNGTRGNTVNHGLDKAPDYIWIQRMDDPNYNGTVVYHSHMGTGIANQFPNASYAMRTFTTAAAIADAAYWGDVAPDSSVITLGESALLNGSGITYQCYCWHSVPGYSDFGSYISNVDPNGPNIHCGFKPAYIMTCNSEQNTSVKWNMKDNARTPNNRGSGTRLYLASQAAETTHGNETVDFLSNGFKIRGTSDGQNAPDINKVFIYMAFAETPYNSPATAR